VWAGKLRSVRPVRHRRRRSHKLLAATIAVLVLAGIGGGIGLGYHFLKVRADQLQASLTRDLENGQNQLEAGKATLQQANAKHDASLAANASAQFATAASDFQSAIRTADTSQLLQWLERTPQVSDMVHAKHVAVDGVANMGVAISGAGQSLAGLDGELIKPPAAGQGGRTLLTVLNEAQTSLPKIRQDFTTAKAAAAGVDVRVLPAAQQATFLKAKGTIDTALSGIDEFERLVPVMTEVLGGNGTRTYLVEQVNPAELRPGGGFIGTYSLIRASAGTLSVIRSGDSYDLADPRPLPGQRGFIPQPSPYREIIPDISWTFVDSNQFPDFPTNATTAENFVQPRIGKIDGVISIDYYTVAEMLALTGPMSVSGIGALTATDFVPTIVRLDIAGSPNHKTALAAVAGPLMQRVAALPSDQWPSLLGALNTLASQKHLQAYFNNATVETELDRVGWSGSLRTAGAADFMMEVEANYWGNKDNYFLTRNYSIVLTRSGNTLHHVLTVDLINATACGSYVRTSYRSNFRLFVASTASAISDNLRAVKYSNPAPPPGTRAADGWVWDISCGGGRSRTLITYDTAWAPTPKGVSQIYWQKQPGTIADHIAITWNDGAGHSYSTSGTLDQDRVINLTPSGVSLTAGQPAQATLPSLSLG
jgi:hypothetical protein